MRINKERLNISTNIYNETTTKSIIENVLLEISESISKSLGPYGSTSIIEDPHNDMPTITKDGYSILKRFRFEGALENTIAKLIQRVSASLVQTVGDGSTSAVVVANELYFLLNDFFENNNIPRKDVLDLLNVLEELISIEINKMSKKLTTKEELMKIAAISNNNDNHMGELVAEVYEKLDFQGFITLETSSTKNTYYEFTNGIEIPRGYINYVFATEKDKITTKLEEPKYLLINDILEESDMEFIAELLTIQMSSDIPLVIIARGFSSIMENLLTGNKMRLKDKLNIVAIPYRLETLRENQEFFDLSVYLNATIYDKAGGVQYTKEDAGRVWFDELGESNKIIVNEKNTYIIEGKYEQKEIDDRIAVLKNEIEELKKLEGKKDITDDLYQLEKRINRIKGKIATLYVGGNSEIEKMSRKDLVEDSIYSCKSAIKNGYVIGGNLVIPYILTHKHNLLLNKLIKNKNIFIGMTKEEKKYYINKLLELVNNAFSISFKTVLNNKYPSQEELIDDKFNECINGKSLKIYNLKNNKFETIKNTGIINSPETDIAIMNSVFSIIGLLSASNQYIGTTPNYKK